ncbi:MAG: hypothetical protein IPI39_11900 [Candidatus Obscuribacter sp.]|nr:hypothetical protein [Candidatus Obscuribacter sp.]
MVAHFGALLSFSARAGLVATVAADALAARARWSYVQYCVALSMTSSVSASGLSMQVMSASAIKVRNTATPRGLPPGWK